MIGRTLSQYRITASIGAGGMGEVYRATDTRLGRDVAIKVLPAATASDPDRRKRFELEARAASALNHPNILTVYDVGEVEGTIYLATELVEGKTLRELLTSASGEGGIPTKRLLDIGVQTADGLAKAHSAGIVHRDLKPENLMVSRDGYVKILDFGLAKLTETAAPREATGQTATVVAADTSPGTVMGTAGYMSPEQASGQSVDFRSDQFTLGAILYEMATGSRAFQRKTGAETLVAIIREEPQPPLAQAAPHAPAPVRWIVERLLAKDPEERYASTKDLARDLKSVRDHLSETSASGGLEAAEPAKLPRRRWIVPAAAALVLGIAAGFLARGIVAGRGPGVQPAQRLTWARGSIASARFAPDGSVVYSAKWEGLPLDVFTTRAGSAESRSLGLGEAKVLSISPAGDVAVLVKRRQLFGFEAPGTLARVPLAGGAPREVLENVEDADWSPDGKSLAVARIEGNSVRVEYPIGKVLYRPAGWASHVRVSPDAGLVAFLDHPRRGDNNGTVKVVDADGKVRLDGPPANTGLAWSARGDEVWSSTDAIQATTLSGKTRLVWSAPGSRVLDIARDGRVLSVINASRREIVGHPAGEKVDRNLTWLNWSFPMDLSRDGKMVLFQEQNQETPSMYLRKLDGSPAVRIGEGNGWGISPDGRWITAEPAPGQLAIVPLGAGETRLLAKTDLHLTAAIWFPDGKRLLFAGSERGRGSRLFIQDVDGGKPRPITPDLVSFLFHALSPDGKTIVATGSDGRLALYSTEPASPRPVPGVEAGDIPLRWTPDGKSIYVYRPTAPPLRVELLEIATGKRSLWKELVPPDPGGVEQMGPVMISDDGTSYVYSYRRTLDDLYVVPGMH
jgi:eukaryotic-like serine/threonine-protein kinase